MCTLNTHQKAAKADDLLFSLGLIWEQAILFYSDTFPEIHISKLVSVASENINLPTKSVQSLNQQSNSRFNPFSPGFFPRCPPKSFSIVIATSGKLAIEFVANEAFSCMLFRLRVKSIDLFVSLSPFCLSVSLSFFSLSLSPVSSALIAGGGRCNDLLLLDPHLMTHFR